ncbi:MAG: hypothetical protein QNJ54_22265 [Prochloraceae cyanobacterium]|nr:hypothetical protein [Prochloraceae cyanobacterium]
MLPLPLKLTHRLVDVHKDRQFHFTIASSISRSPVPFYDRQFHFTIASSILRSPVPFYDRQNENCWFYF